MPPLCPTHLRSRCEGRGPRRGKLSPRLPLECSGREAAAPGLLTEVPSGEARLPLLFSVPIRVLRLSTLWLTEAASTSLWQKVDQNQRGSSCSLVRFKPVSQVSPHGSQDTQVKSCSHYKVLPGSLSFLWGVCVCGGGTDGPGSWRGRKGDGLQCLEKRSPLPHPRSPQTTVYPCSSFPSSSATQEAPSPPSRHHIAWAPDRPLEKIKFHLWLRGLQIAALPVALKHSLE